MKIGTTTKQPFERFSYTAQYSEALTDGDNLESVIATVSPSGLTVDNVGIYDTRVKFWVEGGTAGLIYKVTLSVITADGRRFQDEITFKIKEL